MRGKEERKWSLRWFGSNSKLNFENFETCPNDG
jgi:hypothetical protein